MTVKTYEFGQQDQSLLYCNGICANFEDNTQRAGFEEQTNLLRSVFPHRKVVVFNNPTGIGEFFSDSQAQKEKTEAIADQFRKVILSQLESRPHEQLPIVVHSHGALIAKLALEKLDRVEREKLHVYAFGGVVMLPKSLGHSVRNFVFKGDLISRNANKKFDPEGILERIMKVTKRSMRKRIDIKDALFAQFKKDWFGEYKWGTEKIPEYVGNFWTGNPENVKGADEAFKLYASCITDYDVTVLTSTKKMPLKINDLVEVTPEMKESIASFGNTVDKLYHVLPNFRPVLQEIAKSF